MAASGTAAPAAAAEQAAPFDAGLARLSEILGSLHYLRGLCGANEGNKWRAEMQALLDAEAPSGQRRSQFIARFNHGYRAYLQTYHTCTPAAEVVIRRYLEEGSKIAREVTARYSN
ncbi:MAG TPA: TIGR02301 family protein [Xanthobacteraceae bacterium]|nr:TIGR02301 family protein [Xanthobacteraceae bacterium]